MANKAEEILPHVQFDTPAAWRSSCQFPISNTSPLYPFADFFLFERLKMHYHDQVFQDFQNLNELVGQQYNY